MGIKGRPTVRKDGAAASSEGIKPLDPEAISKTSAEYRSIELWNYKLENMLVILSADDMTSKHHTFCLYRPINSGLINCLFSTGEKPKPLDEFQRTF